MIKYLKNNGNLLFRLALALLSAWIVSLVLFAKPNEHFIPFFFLLFFPLLKFNWGEFFISLLTVISAILLPSYLLTHCATFSSEMLWILLNTNTEETLAYIVSTPTKHTLYVLCILVVFFVLLYFWHRNKYTAKGYWFMFVVALVISPYVLSHSQLKTMYSDLQEVLSSKDLPSPSWHVTKHIDDSVNTFVVVIGESLRKDALSLYGAPWNTTSRLHKLPLRLIDGYVATGFNTTLAIPRILCLPKKTFGNFEEQNNIILLATENLGV